MIISNDKNWWFYKKKVITMIKKFIKCLTNIWKMFVIDYVLGFWWLTLGKKRGRPGFCSLRTKLTFVTVASYLTPTRPFRCGRGVWLVIHGSILNVLIKKSKEIYFLHVYNFFFHFLKSFTHRNFCCCNLSFSIESFFRLLRSFRLRPPHQQEHHPGSWS